MQVSKRPTYADVAREAGVSQTTVSFVLNGRASDMSIPQATCDRVHAAANRMGYRPNRLARSLAKGETSTLGVVVPRLESSFFAHIVHGIQEVADEHHSRILLGYSRHEPAREAEQVGLLLDHRVEALICLADEFTAGSMGDWLDRYSRSIPIVVVDEGSWFRQVDCVVPDDESGVLSAMRHLISSGHKRIAHVAGPAGHSTTAVRLTAYKKALVEARLPYEPEYVIGQNSSPELLAPEIRDLLSLSTRPTAVLAANDVRAARVAEAMREAGLRYPDDIELIGFGNMELSRSLGFSTVDQDPKEMGRVAAKRAFARLGSKLNPTLIKTKTQLLLRDGVGNLDYSMV